jgi:ribosomal protein S18 acetylase RimI-like enzyme
MLAREYKENNYRLLICSESDHFKIERISPHAYVGYLQMNAKDGRLEICDLWVNEEPEDFRGKGFGSTLIQHAFEYSEGKGIDIVFGHTQIDDFRVHSFYKKCEFQVFIDKKHDTAWFIRSLSGEIRCVPDFEELAKIAGLINEFNFHAM